MQRRCLCVCHEGASPEGIRMAHVHVGVDVADPVAAATACSQCLPVHAVALLETALPNDPPPEPPRPPVVPKKKQPWVDPPPTFEPKPNDGEDGG